MRADACLNWARRTFGPVASHRDERAARLVEEAIELAQASGLFIETVAAIVERVYSRPPGDLRKEVGQVALGIEVFALNERMLAEVEAAAEWARIQTIPQEEWTRRHAEKVALGIADLSS